MLALYVIGLHERIWRIGGNATDGIGKRSCPSATLYTTKPLRTVLGMKTGFWGEIQANSDAKPWHNDNDNDDKDNTNKIINCNWVVTR